MMHTIPPSPPLTSPYFSVVNFILTVQCCLHAARNNLVMSNTDAFAEHWNSHFHQHSTRATSPRPHLIAVCKYCYWLPLGRQNICSLSGAALVYMLTVPLRHHGTCPLTGFLGCSIVFKEINPPPDLSSFASESCSGAGESTTGDDGEEEPQTMAIPHSATGLIGLNDAILDMPNFDAEEDIEAISHQTSSVEWLSNNEYIDGSHLLNDDGYESFDIDSDDEDASSIIEIDHINEASMSFLDGSVFANEFIDGSHK